MECKSIAPLANLLENASMFQSIDALIAVANWDSSRTWAAVLGVLAAIVSIALIITSWTRWGQTKPLTKCVILAVLAHVWLLMYAYGTRIISPGLGDGNGGLSKEYVSMGFIDEPPSLAPEVEPDPNQDVAEAEPLVAPDLLAAPEPKAEEPIEAPPLLDVPKQEVLVKDEIPAEAPPLDLPPPPLEPTTVASQPDPPPIQELPKVTPPDVKKPVADLVSLPKPAKKVVRPVDQVPVPKEFENRFSEDRLALAKRYGGDANTEVAVEWGLRWLAANQSSDGHWDAAQHGAGNEDRQILGISRPGTGRKADTAMTGLALLAFLGAGHTHMHGEYASNVRSGLEYLLEEQMSSGDLAGRKQIGKSADVHYSRMYSHGMATLAIAEAFALTGDARLRTALEQATQFTLRAQKPHTGGWRYLTTEDDPGDLSQFGWQAISLHSAQMGGMPMPNDLPRKLENFLDLVAAGREGGLATYRPRSISGQKPTPAMTAEALACRTLLNLRGTALAEREAKEMLLANLPGNGEANLYYWYYGTLGLFQFQDQAWGQWNEALKTQLLSTQMPADHPEAGSWNGNCVWANYGGRVYCTALSCMCLEVYYRYLPMYR